MSQALIDKIKTYPAPTPQQKILLEIAEKTTAIPKEAPNLTALIRAELMAEKIRAYTTQNEQQHRILELAEKLRTPEEEKALEALMAVEVVAEKIRHRSINAQRQRLLELAEKLRTPAEEKALEKMMAIEATAAKIEAYSNPDKQQQMLVELAGKLRTPAEEKTLKALLLAEVAAEKAEAMKKAAAGVIRDVSREAVKAERSARTHQLCESAGLLILAGLVDKVTGKPTRDRGELLGLLLKTAKIADTELLASVKKTGDAVLAGIEVHTPNPPKLAKASKPTETAPRPAQTPADIKPPAQAQKPPQNAPAAPSRGIAGADTRLTTKFEDKEEVKHLGARFHAEGRYWYVPAGSDLAPFARWLPQAGKEG